MMIFQLYKKIQGILYLLFLQTDVYLFLTESIMFFKLFMEIKSVNLKVSGTRFIIYTYPLVVVNQ